MADRYWVGGAGTWSTSTTPWSASSGGAGGASAPTAADSVFFDQAATYTVTMTGALTCLDITVSAGTVTFATGTTPTLAVSGNMSLAASTVWNSTGTITFNSSVAVRTVTTNGVTLSCPVTVSTSFSFTGIILGSSLTTSNTTTTTLTQGTLNLAGFTLTTGIFSSSGTGSRRLLFGTGNVVLAHPTAGTTVLGMAQASNLTLTGTGGFVSDAAVTRTYSVGNVTPATATSAPSLTLTGSGTAVATLTTGSWFNTLDFGTTAFTLATTSLNLNGLTLSPGSTYTSLTATMVGTGMVTPNGKTISAFTVNHAGTTTFAGALACATYTQTAGTINFATFNLTCSGAAGIIAGTLTNTGTITCTTWTVNGTFTMTSGTITPSTSFVLASGAFNYNGGTLSAVPTFTHTAGTVTLGQAYALTATGTYTLTAGTLNLNGYNLTVGIFSSISGTRTIAFGTGNIILAHTTAGTTVLSMTNAVGVTRTGTGGFVSDASVTRTYVFGSGSTTNAPNLTLTGSGTAVATLSSGSWFNTLDFGTTAFNPGTTSLNLNGLTLSSSGTYTSLTATMRGTGTVTPNGKTIAAFNVNHTVAGITTLAGALNTAVTATTTLFGGTLDLAGFTLTTGTFNSSTTTARSIAFGSGNIVLATTTAGQAVLAIANATNFTWTGTGGFVTDAAVTRFFEFGWSAGGSATNAPNLSITSGAAVPTFANGSNWFNSLNFTGTTCTPSQSGGQYVSTLTLATGGTYTDFAPVFTRTQTWTAQFSKQLGGIGVGAVGVTLTLDATQTYTATSSCFLTAGTLDLGGYDLTIGLFSSNNSNARSVAFGSNNIILAHTTSTTTVLSAANATNFTWTGTGGFTVTTSVQRTFTFGTTGGSTTNAPNLSITGGFGQQTFTDGSWFNSLNFTGSGSGAVMSASTIGIYVSTLTLANINGYTGFAPVFTRTQTWTAQFSRSLGGIGVGAVGVTLTLDATQTYSVSSTCFLNAGTLDLGGVNLTIGSIISNNSNARSIAFGSNNIVLAASVAGTTVLSMATATGFTYTGTGGFTTTAAVTRTFTFGTTGGSTTNAPNLSITSGASVPTFTDGSWFKSLNFTGTTSTPAMTATTLGVYIDTLTLATGGTYTGFVPVFTRTQTWTAQFTKQLGGIGVGAVGVTVTLDATQTYTATSSCLVNAGTLDLGGYDLTVGIFGSNSTNTRSIAFGSNNIVLAHTTAATTVLSAADATNFSWTGTGGFTADASITRTFTFGTTGGTAANAPNLTLTGSGIAVATLTTGSWFNNFTFGTTAFTLAATSLNFNSLTLSSGGTFTALSATMRGTGTVTPNGKTIAAFGVNTSGTTTLAGALACTTYTQTAGTIDFATFNLTCSSSVTYQGATSLLSNIGVITCTTFTVTTGGTLTLTSGTITPSSSFFVSGTGVFNYNGGTLSAVPSFQQFGTGTVTLGQSYALTATGTYAHISGILNLNGYNLTTGIFSSSYSTARSIAFGTGNIILAHTTAATTVLSMATATNFTQTGTGGFVSDSSVTRTFTFGSTAGGSTTTAPNLSITSGAAVPTFTDGSWFKSLNFTGTTSTPAMTAIGIGIYVDTLTLATGGTYTGFAPVFTRTQTWTAQFAKQLGGIGVGAVGVTLTLNATQTYTTTSSCFLTAGTLDLGGVNLTIGGFRSDNSNARSIVFGSNNIVLVYAASSSAVLIMHNATNFTWTGTGGFVSDASFTRFYTFGSTAGGSATNAPNLSITTGSNQPTLTNGSWFNTLDFGSIGTGFGGIFVSATLNLNSLILSTQATDRFRVTSMTANMRGTGTITPRGHTLGTLTVDHAGTTTLAAALTIGTSTTLTAGTLNLAGFTLTTPAFSSGAAAARSISGNGIVAVSGAWTVSDGAGFTGSAYTVNMTSSSAKSFAGAGGSYGTLVQASDSALTVSGSNGFADIQATAIPSTISFAAGTTQTVSAFTLAGSPAPGSLVTINSVTQGSQFTLSKNSGIVTVSYLSIRDSNVTGGAEWYNDNGTNTVLTNNTGWNGGPAPVSTVTGQFMAFF